MLVHIYCHDLDLRRIRVILLIEITSIYHFPQFSTFKCLYALAWLNYKYTHIYTDGYLLSFYALFIISMKNSLYDLFRQICNNLFVGWICNTAFYDIGIIMYNH